jgi:hypothetical protein
VAVRAQRRGDLYVPQVDPMTVDMHGLLHKDHLQIDELKLGAFGGNAVLAVMRAGLPSRAGTCRVR